MKIVIRYVTENDLISRLIRLHTDSEFSHVEFLLPEGGALGAHHSGGVAIRPIDYAKFTDEERYTVDLPDLNAKAVLDYAHSQVGKPYDTTAIFGILANRDWREEDSWICSELVASCFEKGGWPIVHAGIKTNRISPGGLYLSTVPVPLAF